MLEVIVALLTLPLGVSPFKTSFPTIFTNRLNSVIDKQNALNWVENNIDKIKERKKHYYEEHKGQILAEHQSYYEAKKERARDRDSQKIKCD